ncbi:IS3 family transposase [Streptomyces sp. 2131.1]|uniref:IS3 family transposase n=1 Tax=Streptomyces sp. 2131.1 TaxID=1855346 RepID=UPI003525EAD9
MCRDLDLPISACNGRRKRPKPARRLRDEGLLADIRCVHTDSGETYGARRIDHGLLREGVVAPRCTVERLMREHGLAYARQCTALKKKWSPVNWHWTHPAPLHRLCRVQQRSGRRAAPAESRPIAPTHDEHVGVCRSIASPRCLGHDQRHDTSSVSGNCSCGALGARPPRGRAAPCRVSTALDAPKSSW